MLVQDVEHRTRCYRHLMLTAVGSEGIVNRIGRLPDSAFAVQADRICGRRVWRSWLLIATSINRTGDEDIGGKHGRHFRRLLSGRRLEADVGGGGG